MRLRLERGEGKPSELSNSTIRALSFAGRSLEARSKESELDRYEPCFRNLAAIDNALSAIEQQLSSLIGLTPDLRRQLTKMGDKSEAFCRQAVDVLGENPGILPRDFDFPGLRRDLQMLDVLRPRIIRMRKLQQLLDDSEMALGSDVMSGALEGYSFLKVAGKGKGLDELRKMLAVRFSKRGTTSNTELPAALPAA